LTPSATARIDTAIHAVVAAEVAGFEKEVEAERSTPLPKGVAPASLTGSASTDYAGSRLVGVTLDDYDFPAGAAHGLTVRTTMVFDATTGRRYQLADLFRPGSDWLGVLSRASRRLLAEQVGHSGLTDTGTIDAGTTPKAANFAAWALTPFGMTVTFGDYQVGAYALGDPQILLSYASLAAVARRGGPGLGAAAGAPAATAGPSAMPLLPATSPPVGGLCYRQVGYPHGEPSPLTCGSRVNVAAWSVLSAWMPLSTGPSFGLLGLPAGSDAKAVRAAMCTERATFAQDPGAVVTAEQIAGAYHGWPFTASAASGFPRFCAKG
jgi:hypothetical protein